MEKYYEKKYASGRGDYINIYDEDLNLVRWEKTNTDKLNNTEQREKIIRNVIK